MASTPSATMLNVGAIAQVATGTEQEAQATRLGSQRATFLEQPGFEMGRSGRSMIFGTSAVAGGQVPVVDIPTTTAGWVVNNANAQGSGKLLHIKRVGLFYASGTAGADGAALVGGVTGVVLATQLTANGSNHKSACTRGYGTVNHYIDVGKTVAGVVWGLLTPSTPIGAATVTGLAQVSDVSALGLVVPPNFAFAVSALGDTGTTAKYGITIWADEIDGDLP